MKKIFSYCILLFLFCSCSNLRKELNWKEIKENEVFLNLEAGDIIVKEKQFSLLGMFGHSAIMKDKRTVVDYPKLGEKAYEIDINYWLEKDRDILILRYKDMNELFKKKLLENIEKYKNKDYGINLNKKNSTSFYCSQFIWYVYYKTAQELGYYLDIDSNGGIFIYPYDFLESKNLEIID